MCTLKLVSTFRLFYFLSLSLTLTVHVTNGRELRRRHAAAAYQTNNRIDYDEFDSNHFKNKQSRFPVALAQGGNIYGQEFILTQLQAYQELFDEFAVPFSEDMAEEAIIKCYALNITLDYEGLKNDLITCTRKAVKKLIFKCMEIAAVLRSPETLVTFYSVLNPHNRDGLKLNSEQKEYLTTRVLTPFCQTVVPLASECEKPEYIYSLQMDQCQSDVEKDVQQLAKIFINDICRNDASWVFELLEAHPEKCANAISNYQKTTEHKKCRGEWMKMVPDMKNLDDVERFQFESVEQFCNVSRVYRKCLSNWLIDSCPKNPKLGDVMLNIFTESRSWLNAKCGTSGARNLSASFWFVMLFAMIARSLELIS